MSVFKNKKIRTEKTPEEEYEEETSISGVDKTFTTIKCLGFPKENGVQQIQISIENHPYSLRVMKWLTIKEARQFMKILDYQISLAEDSGGFSSFFAKKQAESHDT